MNLFRALKDFLVQLKTEAQNRAFSLITQEDTIIPFLLETDRL
jgi:hypothetical protein